MFRIRMDRIKSTATNKRQITRGAYKWWKRRFSIGQAIQFRSRLQSIAYSNCMISWFYFCFHPEIYTASIKLLENMILFCSYRYIETWFGLMIIWFIDFACTLHVLYSITHFIFYSPPSVLLLSSLYLDITFIIFSTSISPLHSLCLSLIAVFPLFYASFQSLIYYRPPNSWSIDFDPLNWTDL